MLAKRNVSFLVKVERGFKEKQIGKSHGKTQKVVRQKLEKYQNAKTCIKGNKGFGLFENPI